MYQPQDSNDFSSGGKKTILTKRNIKEKQTLLQVKMSKNSFASRVPTNYRKGKFDCVTLGVTATGFLK